MWKINQTFKTKEVSHSQEPIKDADLFKKFLKKAEAYYNKNGGAGTNDYKNQMSSKSCEIDLIPASYIPLTGRPFYNELKKKRFSHGEFN